jgi:esterase
LESIKLNYKEFGDGAETIVILHGLFGMLDNWQTIGKRLAESGYRVLLLDQRDHGKSPHTSEINYDILAADLNDFLISKNIQRAHIIGHSMGGKVAMNFAFKYRAFVNKLIVIDIANKIYKGDHQPIFNAIFSCDVSIAESRESIEEHFGNHGLDEGTRQFIMKNLQRKIEVGYEWKMNVNLLHTFYTQLMAQVGTEDDVSDAQTMFIKGEVSNYITSDDENMMQKQFPNAIVEVIEGAGHWVHAEKPKETFDAILNFLKS